MSPQTSDFRSRILERRHPSDLLLSAGATTIWARDLVERSSFGSEPNLFGQNVMICVREALSCALALVDLDGLASRIVICPPELSSADLALLAERSSAKFLIKERDDKTKDEIAGKINLLDFEPLGFPISTPTPFVPIATEWVLLTSGTTGTPKMVSHSFQSLTSNIKMPTAQNRAIVWASFNDTRRFSGLQMFLQSMLSGSTLILRRQADSIPDLLPSLAAHGATHVSGTPTHWRKVLMFADRAKLGLEQITLVGEIADQALLDALHAAFPSARISHIYGSTETGTGFSVHDGVEGFPASFIGRDFGAMEFALDGEKLKVRSARSARNYLGSGEKLKDVDGFIDTGDSVKRVGERYIFLGRRSGTINVGGSHVHPEEVEGVLNADPRVRMCLVRSTKSPFTGSIVIAEVVIDTAARRLESDSSIARALLSYCQNNLAPYKVPAIIRIVDDIAANASGKMERRHA